jgi:hypothetical protein
MTEKEQKYRAHFRNIGKHLHRHDYLPINLAKHPTEFNCEVNRERKKVLVDWGWPAKVMVNNDGGYTITATIPNYSIEWKY